MIWYLLHPFRGTTEPPQLSPSHPLRRAFHAHGTATARHWQLSLLLTIVISVLLCYPAVFQTDSAAAVGLRNLPKHVWTSTTEVAGDRPADIEMRQVWVHGDYMKALDKRVLQQALHVQNALVGHGLGEDTAGERIGDAQSRSPDQSGCLTADHGRKWGFQSPLMYWDCSLRAIEEDSDLLATINSKTHEHSALNLTLRPSTVFAGKAFANKKLRAADALVITLFDQTKSNLGHIWESRSRKLAQELGLGWYIFPQDGQITRSRLYEFRFKPMTFSDDLLLACSYLFTAAYVIWKMMQLRAVKSWFGLLITICVKMTICIIASFTVCTYLGIDLARIPRPWFPGVVFCFGLGNIFRLINVVLETPPEMPPVQRIANALGEVGHLSLAVAGQNLLLIYICSQFVTPMVADFCVFAAVTLVLDFVFHLTFFLAVLSVDVQRMELQDSLTRVDETRASKSSRQERQSWLAALLQGNHAVSTRFAGSAAIFSMILAVNWHFFDGDVDPRSVIRSIRTRTPKAHGSSLWSPPPINQARTPAEWLRLQDHNTAREMFGFISTSHAHSFIARVYDPLLVIMDGAQGRDTAHRSLSLLQSVQHFAHNHAFPAALIAVFMIAVVILFMNYLLWTGLPDDAVEDHEDEETHFSVKTLPIPQTLDVVRLATCAKGHLVSVSLDRSTSLWLNGRGTGYANKMIQTATMKPKLWPIVACAMDDGGRRLALASDNGQVGLWSIRSAQFVLFCTVELHGQTPILFSLISTQHGAEHDKLSLVIVTPDGYLSVMDAYTGSTQTKRVCPDLIASATLYTCVKGEICLVYACKAGEVYILPITGGSEWTPEIVAGLDPSPPLGSSGPKAKTVYGACSLGLIFAIRAEVVEIVDFNSRALIHSQKTRHVKPGTFRVMHSARRPCACGAPAVHTLSIAYTEYDTSRMVMHTFMFDDSAGSQICLSKPSENGVGTAHTCHGLHQATEEVHIVEPAGVWESTSTLSVMGIRQCTQSHTASSSVSGVDYAAPEPSVLASALKLRATPSRSKASATRESHLRSFFPGLDSAFSSRHSSSSSPNNNRDSSESDSDAWEAWTLSSTGKFRCRPLISDSPDENAGDPDSDQQLFVASLGPIKRLGSKSVAVGYGNTVKIVTVGRETFEGVGEDGVDLGLGGMGVGRYKWKGRRTGRGGGGAGGNGKML